MRAPCLALVCTLSVLVSGAACARGESVRLKATADIWVSSFPKEETFTAGAYGQLKLKSIQEMAVIRFDARPAAGRRVASARLMLHPRGKNMLRYVRVSTCATDWVEGTRKARLGEGDGASYNYADNAAKRSWAWPGSQLCDVIMGSGWTRSTWAERKVLDNGWISVALPPEMIYALLAGDTDGLAVMDGGMLGFFNNFVDSVQSKNPPYIEVELTGKPMGVPPAAPKVETKADMSRAHLASGAIRVTIASDPIGNVFCYRLKLNGKPVERWRVPPAAKKIATQFTIEDLPPDKKCQLEVVAVSPYGQASEPARLTVASSPALPAPPKLAELKPPTVEWEPPAPAGPIAVWAAPPLVKIDPLTGRAMFDDVGGKIDYRSCNAVYAGGEVRLSAARGETASFQVIVEKRTADPLKALTVSLGPLAGAAGATIPAANVYLYKCWYAKNRSKKWQPAYCVPMTAETTLDVPDPARKLAGQKTQAVYVEVYVPRGAKAGTYRGEVKIAGGAKASLPVRLEVLDFDVPDEPCFWPQFNSYNIPKRWHDYFRVARDNRCVWYYRFGSGGPKTTGKGKGLKINWSWWDANYGPLLSGEAFKDCRGGARPIETVALPFWDSWPTPLTKKAYNYKGHWPGKGEDRKHLTAHYMTAPYIGDGLSRDYKDAFVAAERQFIEHFKAKGWTKTEAQCVFVGKITHRTNFGVNMWFHTDEPYHWDDWLALQFFFRLWRQGRSEAGGDADRWTARADISRPQWQGRVLAGGIDTAYFGGFARPVQIRRCQVLARTNPLELRAYGSASADNVSATASLVWVVNSYLNGASAVLPWQSMGSDKALDSNDSGIGGGNALICPGDRFGTPPVADIRVKAARDGEQICEYLKIVAERYQLNREQVRAMVAGAVKLEGSTKAGASADNADALIFSRLKAWQIAGLRRSLAELIVAAPGR